MKVIVDSNKSFRISNKQRDIIINFLSKPENRIFVKHGQDAAKTSSEDAKRMWTRLALYLNAIGDSTRTPEKWKKAFIEMKYHARKKIRTMKSSETTGDNNLLTGFEEKLLTLTGNLKDADNKTDITLDERDNNSDDEMPNGSAPKEPKPSLKRPSSPSLVNNASKRQHWQEFFGSISREPRKAGNRSHATESKPVDSTEKLANAISQLANAIVILADKLP